MKLLISVLIIMCSAVRAASDGEMKIDCVLTGEQRTPWISWYVSENAQAKSVTIRCEGISKEIEALASFCKSAFVLYANCVEVMPKSSFLNQVEMLSFQSIKGSPEIKSKVLVGVIQAKP